MDARSRSIERSAVGLLFLWLCFCVYRIEQKIFCGLSSFIEGEVFDQLGAIDICGEFWLHLPKRVDFCVVKIQ